MMKAVFRIMCLAACLACLRGHELPLFGPVPSLNGDWKARERKTEVQELEGRLRASYLVLTNARTGDFLSFSVEKLNSGEFPKANRIPWSDMAGARFPGGYPIGQLPEEYNPVAHWLRNDIVDLSVADANRKSNHKEQALEYTLIFEDRRGPSRLAHGYMIPMGAFRIQVQHTSTNVITPEFAHSMISAMFSDYVNRENIKRSARGS